MERKGLEARLAHVQQQRGQVEAQRNQAAQALAQLNETLLRINGGVLELEWLLSQVGEGTEGVPSDAPGEGGDAE